MAATKWQQANGASLWGGERGVYMGGNRDNVANWRSRRETVHLF